MKQIIDYLQSVLMANLMGKVALSADLLAGQDTVFVQYATYFYPGQTVIIRNNSIGEGFQVLEVLDSSHIKFYKPAQNSWLVSDGAVLERSEAFHHLKYILRGDPQVIPDYPAITISPGGRNIEWFTLQSTTEQHTAEIYIYVLEDSQESSTDLLMKYTDATAEVLMLNLFPELTGDVVSPTGKFDAGSATISISDNTGYHPGSIVVLEDVAQREVRAVNRVIDSHILELDDALFQTFDSSVNPFTVSRAIRMIYDSRISSIEYGFVQKGSAFLKAGHISWYGKEMRDRKYPYHPLSKPWMHHVEMPREPDP